jgi:serine/threonine protein kinase/Tol biopolymer transport system component
MVFTFPSQINRFALYFSHFRTMAVALGDRLGPYEILSALGAGGMGEVYKARDTRLDRTVAVKILPDALAADSQFRERFDREARAISQLTHPHICTVYDVGVQQGTAFLVMEYLDGETLAERLTKGALPLADALRIAIQIADALSTAHRRGIIHRDLKPGNVMQTKAGAKLLDFGLAKTGAPVVAGAGGSMVPTTPPHLTAQGTILGTFQYMAPEQLEGHEADARTDVFAFGAVVYEMVTGTKAFEGKSQASLMAAILERDPPLLSTIQPLTPPALDHVVQTCLAKDPDDRWQTAREVLRELTWTADRLAHGLEGRDAQLASPRWRRPVPLVAAGLVGAVAALVASASVWMMRPTASPASSGVARLTIALPSGDQVVTLKAGGGLQTPALALSPDGRLLVYVGIRDGRQQLYVRSLDSLESRPITGTDGATNPFFSPDGQWVGFFAQGKLRKVSVIAGAVQVLCEASIAMGGSWGPDNSIYFAATNISGLSKVSASGGTAEAITKLDRSKGEVSHRWPQVLPGGKALLFTVWTGPGSDEREIDAQSLDSGQRHVLVRGGDTGRYVPTGHLVYARADADALMAVPMDLARLEVSGAPATLPEEVLSWGEGAQYAVSDVGILLFLPGNAQRFERRLVWVDRKGTVEPLPAPARPYNNPAISPDGRRAVVDIEGGTWGTWIYDFSRTTLTPLSTRGSSQAPIWTPDGKRVAYRGTRTGFRNVFWKAVDSASEEERLTTKEGTSQTPGSFSSDGNWLAFSELSQATGADIWVLRMDDHTSQPFLATRFAEGNPRFSPDGRWLAYVSDESGRPEIYVQPFPATGDKWPISTDGGTEPVWSRTGRELFYVNGDTLMAVDITTQPTFAARSPRLLFQGRYGLSPTASSGYDVSPDGQRFLRVQATRPEPPATQINVVMNWFTELNSGVQK